ncbi:MAG TPA: hypothetical protein VGR73_05535 [Bryobacteraceae bacterium]|nr:hypothetical protein [Bryobacteraceae bacterium]
MMETAQPDARKLLRFVHSVVGTIEHAPIPELDQRVRARHQSEIDQLTGLGFNYLCSDGESFPVFRLLLVLPAVVMIDAACERTPISMRGGAIVLGYPILVFRIKPTFAHLDGSHVKFLTAFHEGALLVSGNYDDPLPRGPGIVTYCHAGTMAETWAEHQERIRALEAGGGVVDRRNGYETYVELTNRHNAAW